jgi:hypothetical protein
MEKKKLTPEKEAEAMLLAARAANWAIHNAKTKFTPEQQDKIHAEALRSFREKAMAEVDSNPAVKAENAD